MIINMNGAKAPETPSPTLQEKTVTPETLPTVIGADEGYDGLSQVTVNPDPQLIPTNIRSGKTIFGVEGAFVGAPTDEFDIYKLSDIGSYNMSYIPVVGSFNISTGTFQGEYIESDNTIGPSTGRANTPSSRASFKYGTSQIIGLDSEYSPSVSSSVPSGYYWVHIQRTIPEGDYLCNSTYTGAVIGGYSWNGTIHIPNAYLYLASASGDSEQIYSIPTSEVYGQALKIELGDITLDVVNGLTQVHLPQVELDVWLGRRSESYKYWLVSLNLRGNYEVRVSV